MKMADLLTVERVIPRLRAGDKQQALRKLAGRAAESAGTSAGVVLRSVAAGAECPAFGPESAVCLIHAFVPGLLRPIVTFARLEPPLEFGAADGSQTDVVALLLSPAEGSVHLQALACIARTVRDTHVRKLMRAARSADSLYIVLCGTEDQHWSIELRPGGISPLKHPDCLKSWMRHLS
jgi:PTS system nitrogen regulatory IIA component